jgi:hypothetical protein
LNIEGKKKLSKLQKDQLKQLDKMVKSPSIRDKIRMKEYLEKNDMYKTAQKDQYTHNLNHLTNRESISKLKNDLLGSSAHTGRGLFSARNTINTFNMDRTSSNPGKLTHRANRNYD